MKKCKTCGKKYREDIFVDVGVCRACWLDVNPPKNKVNCEKWRCESFSECNDKALCPEISLDGIPDASCY